jgi:hypothetical protein
MQAISAYHEAKSTRLAISELNVHGVGMLQERNNFVAKDSLGHAADAVEKQSREIASTERHEPPTGQFPEHARAKARYPPTVFIDNVHFAHVIADALYRVR